MKKKNITIILLLLLFFLLIGVITHKIDGVDQRIYEIISSIRMYPIDVILLGVTTLLNPIIICLLCILSMILYKEKNRIFIPINLVSITVIVHTLKYIFRRPRPEANLIGETGFSLPSAHACVSLAFIGFLLYLIYIESENNKKWVILILGIILILLIGISRVYLGVHYFSDVMIGYLIAILYLMGYIHILKKYHYLKN